VTANTVKTKKTYWKWKKKEKTVETEMCFQQYEQAIKDYKAGKPVDFDELPTPPGTFSLIYLHVRAIH